jgi:hypothetical protein
VAFDQGLHKRGCDIVTAAAAAVVHLSDGRPVLAVLNEAVKNEGSDTTLISEFQVKESKVVVGIDSISKEAICSTAINRTMLTLLISACDAT